MKYPRHIISDLSEVLILGLGGNDCPLSQGLNLNEKERFDALGGKNLLSLLRGHSLEADYLSGVISANQWDIKPSALGKLIRANFEVRNTETISLMRHLSLSCQLTLLSDHAKEWVDTILELHPFIAELFKVRIFSFETGYIKREPEMFKIALGRLGALPSECLFIDDSAANVVCARGLGIDAIQYVSADQLASELNERKLLSPSWPRIASFERGTELIQPRC